ncbi:hypothetical protein TUBRATIS_20090 [Tubulinosema ratisbonensis]|uniref:Uncharacterized protein n=1 Tax=Tubulinosema ratisbonensis TaxID=291195 RepID=A0A437AKF8_9MICR|nr:hypothetical protein TUBRATIS_20090 [Tubulinosema ratisbonensis]
MLIYLILMTCSNSVSKEPDRLVASFMDPQTRDSIIKLLEEKLELYKNAAKAVDSMNASQCMNSAPSRSSGWIVLESESNKMTKMDEGVMFICLDNYKIIPEGIFDSLNSEELTEVPIEYDEFMEFLKNLITYFRECSRSEKNVRAFSFDNLIFLCDRILTPILQRFSFKATNKDVSVQKTLNKKETWDNIVKHLVNLSSFIKLHVNTSKDGAFSSDVAQSLASDCRNKAEKLKDYVYGVIKDSIYNTNCEKRGLSTNKQPSDKEAS